MSATYTVYRIWLDKLSEKQHLDNWQEVEEWAMSKRFGHIRVIRDQDGKTRDALLTTQIADSGEHYDIYDFVS